LNCFAACESNCTPLDDVCLPSAPNLAAGALFIYRGIEEDRGEESSNKARGRKTSWRSKEGERKLLEKLLRDVVSRHFYFGFTPHPLLYCVFVSTAALSSSRKSSLSLLLGACLDPKFHPQIPLCKRRFSSH
jgi:hypothetical protein